MINLDYYYRTDIYDINTILTKGLIYDYYKTSREYGFGLYLVNKKNVRLNNKDLIVNVHLKSNDNILVVANFEELLTLIAQTVPAISAYYNNNGKSERLGTKFIQKYLIDNNYVGVLITSEYLLVLYNTENIRTIRIDE